jgi:hypothetical protein
MRGLRIFVVAAFAFGILPALSVAAPMDGSTPLLCAANSVIECTRKGDCDRSSPEEAQVPGFIKVDLVKRVLSSVDGSRTSPITANQRMNGKLMIQGMQNERVWGAVIEEQTGMMTATIGEDDGAIVIVGTCIAP